jgi:hypothetical protein
MSILNFFLNVLHGLQGSSSYGSLPDPITSKTFFHVVSVMIMVAQ